MSGPLINRSLTTIRTELEFLYDSEVITEELYNKLLAAIPTKYQKDMAPWGIDKLSTGEEKSKGTDYGAPPAGPPPSSSTDKLANDFAKASIDGPPPSQPPRSFTPKPLGYCKALYDYSSAEAGDLSFSKGERIAVVEHLSEDWWKGYKHGAGAEKTGVFPSNYVNIISEQEFNSSAANRLPVAPPPEEKSEHYRAPPSPQPPQQQYGYQPSPPQYNQPLQPIQPMQQQPSYGGYAQFPPPSTNYYQQPPPQQYAVAPQQAVVEQPERHSHLKSIGGKFGNAAIFGAGATLGGDLVNSIF